MEGAQIEFSVEHDFIDSEFILSSVGLESTKIRICLFFPPQTPCINQLFYAQTKQWVDRVDRRRRHVSHLPRIKVVGEMKTVDIY